jgi:hypothetical protein
VARGGGINDLVYYGAIGGGLFLGYRLALDGDLGCDAWLAAAELYRSLNRGANPPAPRPGTPAAKGSCTARLGGPTGPAPAPGQPAAPAPAPAAAAPAAQGATTAPADTSHDGLTVVWQAYQVHDDGRCWFDTQWSDGHWDFAGPMDPSSCGIVAGPSSAGPSSVHHLALEDFGGSSVHTDGSNICADHNTNCYRVGRDVFFDQGSDHSASHQWFWATADQLINVQSGDAGQVSDFFLD